MRKVLGVILILLSLFAVIAAFGPPGRENMGGIPGMQVILGGAAVGVVIAVLLLRGGRK